MDSKVLPVLYAFCQRRKFFDGQALFYSCHRERIASKRRQGVFVASVSNLFLLYDLLFLDKLSACGLLLPPAFTPAVVSTLSTAITAS